MFLAVVPGIVFFGEECCQCWKPKDPGRWLGQGVAFSASKLPAFSWNLVHFGRSYYLLPGVLRRFEDVWWSLLVLSSISSRQAHWMLE